MEDFILKALLATIGVAIISGPLGCFVVWRKMAYFGDSLAHSALLGVALGLFYGFNANFGVIIISSLFATGLIWLKSKTQLGVDTSMGILSHSALAFGLIAMSAIGKINFDVNSYLFGDILSVSNSDLSWIYLGGVIVLIIIMWLWNDLVLISINEDIAQTEGIKVFWLNILFTALMTAVIAFSVKVIGVLLITSMLIIPAATAREFATSPKLMAIFATIIGILISILGIVISVNFDLVLGPAIVASAAILFFIITILSHSIKR